MEESGLNTEADPQLQSVLPLITKRWPDYAEKIAEAIRDFYQVRGGLSETHKPAVNSTSMRKNNEGYAEMIFFLQAEDDIRYGIS